MSDSGREGIPARWRYRRPTPAEAAQAQRQFEAMQVERAKRKAATLDWLARLDTITDPLAVAVLELHQRTEKTSEWDEPQCQGCDFDGHEGEPPSWPCRTVRLVAERCGHPAPEWVEL